MNTKQPNTFKHFGLILALLLFALPASASLNDCEKLAKDYQDKHFGDLIFIQPLKDNGAYNLGEYSGHWLNKAWTKERGNYYYDSETDNYFKSESEVLDWYEWYNNKQAAIFNINQGGAPFAIKYHY